MLDEAYAQRLPGELESRIARAENPPAIPLSNFAALDAADDQAVVRPGVRADPQAEDAGAEAGNFEYVAGVGRKRRTRRRRAETVRRIDADEGRVTSDK